MVKILEKFGIDENLDFGQNLWKCRFWSKFMKMSILVKIVGKSWSWSTFSENFDFSQWYLRKSRFGSTFSCWFWSKLNIMLILVKFSKDLDFGQTFTKNSIWVKYFENIDFGWNCRKNFKFGHNFRKMSTWVETNQVVDFGQNWKKFLF